MRAWSRVTELVQPDAPAMLASLHSAATVRLGLAQLLSNNADEGRAHLQTVADNSQPDDLPQQRHHRATALIGTALISAHSGHSEDATALLGRSLDYVSVDDPENLRRDMARALATSSTVLCADQGGLAEMVARHAVKIDPASVQGWIALAEALLAQGNRAQLEEAEHCARRAIELEPGGHDGLLTLYAVLKRRKKRKAAKALLARVPGANVDAKERLARRWTHTLIAMVAHGHAARVKQMLVERNATESLEPLWLAARAELGEDLGPLPAEVLDAVNEVRRMVEEERS